MAEPLARPAKKTTKTMIREGLSHRGHLLTVEFVPRWAADSLCCSSNQWLGQRTFSTSFNTKTLGAQVLRPSRLMMREEAKEGRNVPKMPKTVIAAATRQRNRERAVSPKV
jgi:hypothetical protein